MTNSDELVERLREPLTQKQSRRVDCEYAAADTILSLKSEIEALRGALGTIANERSWAGFSPMPIVERMRELARATLSGSPEG